MPKKPTTYDPYRAIPRKPKPLTPKPGDPKPIIETKSTTPASPKILKQEPLKEKGGTEFMPTSGKTISQIAGEVRAGTASPEELKFTNRPERLQEGGWILPEGFRTAGVGEQPFGSATVSLGGGAFIQSAQPRDFIPEGQHDYATMATYYPEMFEDPKLAPLQEELEAQQVRLKASGVTTSEPRITEDDINLVRAQYDPVAFEQQLIKSIGVNPYTMNPMGEMNYRWRNEGKQIFNQVFGGQIAWTDRGKLNKEELEYWNQTKRQWRADTYKMLNDMRTAKVQEYENAMGNFASRAKTHETALLRRKQEQDEASKMPSYQKLPNDKGQITMWYWDKKQRKLVDSGQVTQLTDADLTPEEKSIGSLVSKLKGSQIQNETAQLILTMNPEMKDDPTIQAMLGGPQNPEIKKAVDEGQAYLAARALKRIKAAQGVTPKVKEQAEPTAEEIEKEVTKVPKEEVKTVEAEDGTKVPIYSLTNSDYDPGNIIINKAGDKYAIYIGPGNVEKYDTVEDVLKRRADILAGKTKVK